MAASKVDAQKIARAAAQGVVIALSAREEAPTGEFHIICGIPREIFDATIVSDPAGGFKVSGLQPQRTG
jgi:hypothetical protein